MIAYIGCFVGGVAVALIGVVIVFVILNRYFKRH